MVAFKHTQLPEIHTHIDKSVQIIVEFYWYVFTRIWAYTYGVACNVKIYKMKLTSLPPPVAGLNYRSVHVWFVVDKMALEEFFPSI
jgi:hypothetical protein